MLGSKTSELVSIILPTYNRPYALKECFESVLSQTYLRWELIVIDDASTPESERVAASFDNARIRYHRNAFHCGLPTSRNIGIALAKGSLLLFIEDDVVLEPDCLETIISSYIELKLKGVKVGAVAPVLLTHYEENSVGHKDGLLDFAYRSTNKKLRVPCLRDKLTGVVHFNFIPEFKYLCEVDDVHSCSLYPREVFREVGGFNGKRFKGNYLYEETDTNIRIRRSGYKFYFEPRAVMHHKIYESGGCRTAFLKYVYYFVKNHILFVAGNYQLKALYMLPSFFLRFLFCALSSLSSFYEKRILN